MARLITLGLAAISFAAAVLVSPAVEPASAGTLWLKSCAYFGDPGTVGDVSGPVWEAQAPGTFSLSNRCPMGGSFQIDLSSQMPYGTNARWHTVTPPSIGITGASTPLNQVLIIPNPSFAGFAASYFWSGGSQPIADRGNCCGGMDYGLGINRNDLSNSRYFGFQVTCINHNGCSLYGKQQLLALKGIELTGQDNTPPSMQALGSGNLWYESSRWVRGQWPISFQAADDSGVCGMRAIVDGQSIQGPTAAANQSSWTQCPTPQTMNQSIDTASYPNGAMSLLLSAADAASPANVSSPSETLQVDNSPVSVALSGPTDALSTAGTQYVTASATAGLSGVSDIECSVDGSPYTAYPGASAQIPVSAIGPHTVNCLAQNNAYDSTLTRASSALASWHLSIRQPTISAITFGARLLDALRCHRDTIRVHLPPRWVTVRRHGQRVRVHRRAGTRLKRVSRCHPRVVILKVKVRGRVRRRRVVLLPHTVQITVKHVRFHRTATIGGWAGLANGTALSNAPVQVITATDNGRRHWRVATVTNTNANGLWHAKLRAGPSRLIAAVYPGSSTTEPSTSGQLRLIAHTKLSLRIRPRIAQWGHTIQITGRVLGGNIPAGKLLRLRIGAAGLSSTAGIPNLNHHGHYHATWTFGAGRGTVRYWFSVSTLPEADYPYAQTSSPRVYITVHG